MPRKLGFIALIAASIAGCLFADNSDYCTEDREGRKCDTDLKTWAEPAPGDMAVVASCKSSVDCKDPNLAICGKDGHCVTCDSTAPTTDAGTSNECAMGHSTLPFCVKGACVQCVSSFDCVAEKKACDKVTHSCQACAKNVDCASGVCESGMCRNPGDVIYVDGKNCGKNGTGAFSDPMCAVQDGMNKGAMTSKPVVIKPGTYQENLTVDGRMMDFVLNVIADGAVSLQPKDSGKPALTVTGDAAHQVTLSFNGFTIEKADKGVSGVKCTGMTTPAKTIITFLRTSIAGNAGYGIDASRCTINLSQCRLGPDNKVGGLNLQTGDGSLTNSLVLGNTGNGGVLIGQMNKVVVANNTFVGNQSIGAVSGLNCTPGPITFNNVFYNNTGANDQVSTDCMPINSAWAGAPAMSNNVDLTNCKPEDLFKNPANFDYHLVKGTPTCTLVDKGASPVNGEPAPTTDYDGNPRPANDKYDIGAFEFQ